MTAYRFCRTDDVPLLVQAYNACYAEPTRTPPITVERFRRFMRELDVWCSSCMVAFEGSDPVGVMIGAKRAHASFIHRIGVLPEHRRRGHARHMLESLARKMAILEPPLLLAEVPADRSEAVGLFEACGWQRGELLADHVAGPLEEQPAGPMRPAPITWAELDASGSLDLPEAGPWCRARESLHAISDALHGLAFVSDLRVEAWLLYRDHEDRAEREILGAQAASGPARNAFLRALLTAARATSALSLRMPGVHPAEELDEALLASGFRRDRELLAYSTHASPG